MLHFRRTFETEKLQLQELNGRLGHYLSRTKQLEQDNACLISEINKLKQQKSLEWENQYKKEMRELRNMVGKLSFEKSQAEMERERVWQEFQMLQAMCCEETGVRKDIGGELKGCEKQLQKAHKTNESLEERLFQLENEYKCMEDAHKQEIAHLRSQVHSRVVPIVTQKFHTAVSMEDVEEYARSVSEGWIDTFEMYQKRLDEMEESIRADQARMDNLQREKMLYISELEKLRTEAEKQSQIQIHLEEECVHMQDSFRADVNEYQITIEHLEQERRALAASMAERVREHQELLQVKMDLGMEVAAYRALLEAERIDSNEVHMRANQRERPNQRERIIDIKMPSQPYSPRTSSSTRQDLRRHLDVRYMEPTSSLRRSPAPTHLRPPSPSRVIPISVSGWAAHQSPPDRRDMVAFAKASQSAVAVTSTSQPMPQSVASSTSKPVAQSAASITSKPVLQSALSNTSKPVAQSALTSTSAPVVQSALSSTSKPVVQSALSSTSKPVVQSALTSTSKPVVQSALTSTSTPVVQSAPSSTSKPVVQSAPSSTREPVAQSEERSQDMQKKVLKETSERSRQAPQKPAEETFSPIPSATADPGSVRVVSPPMMSLGESTETEEEAAFATKRDVSVKVASETRKWDAGRDERGNAYGPESSKALSEIGPEVLDSVSMELIEKVMRPAGLDAKPSSSGDPTVTYHVEKTEQEDGSIKTQIILESKMEEELDLSQDDALEELLSTGVKNFSLEDIKGTPTGSMIENLLSLGIAGGLGNKAVNVEIVEEPIDSLSDEEFEDLQDEVRSMPTFSQPSSMFFQIEELENVPLDSQCHESGADVMKTSQPYSSVQVLEESRDADSPYFGHESQEYFVSTPDDNISDPEEGGISSYGHYGVVDDLSDERYYQEGGLTASKTFARDGSGGYTFMTSEHSFVRESFPEIIEEEIHVSPTVQESMLGYLKEDRHPEEQLRGAIEQLQGSMSTSLREELSLLSRAESGSPQNLAVDVKKVQQSSDNGTMTIVAELNVSQKVEGSGVAEGGYSMRVSRHQDLAGTTEGFTSSTTEVTEKHIKLGPTEKSFTFQMDVNNAQSQGGSQAEGVQGAGFGQGSQSQMTDPPLRVIREKRIATVYLDSANDQ